jgi:hypothetical protein
MKTEKTSLTDSVKENESTEVTTKGSEHPESSERGKKILAGIVVAVIVFGGILSSFDFKYGSLFSQFSGSTVTPSTASSLWQPSTNNPNRTAVAQYAPRLNAIIVNILARGTGLTAVGFTTYLENLNVGISALARSSKYVSDSDVQKMSAYLVYELSDTKTALST